MSNEAFTHAYIVRVEGENAQRSPLVLKLLSGLLCSSGENRPCGNCRDCEKVARGIHPDVQAISRAEGKREIVVEQVRGAVSGALLLPNEAARRVVVIENAETMNINAQNALLKLLEEPPAHIALMLLTGSPGALLPTVRSRCRVVDGGGETQAVPESVKTLALRYFTLALAGGEALCEFSFELDKTDKADFALFLSEVRTCAAAHMRSALSCGDAPESKVRSILNDVATAEEYLRRNVSVLHISALLCCG